MRCVRKMALPCTASHPPTQLGDRQRQLLPEPKVAPLQIRNYDRHQATPTELFQLVVAVIRRTHLFSFSASLLANPLCLHSPHKTPSSPLGYMLIAYTTRFCSTVLIVVSETQRIVTVITYFDSRVEYVLEERKTVQ